MSADTLNQFTIDFPNNNRALALLVDSKTTAQDIISQFNLPEYRSVILNLGGADGLEQKSKAKLTQLFSRGIARGAVEGKAVLIDGGTNTGVMELLGDGIAARGNKVPLIGVAPAAKVSYPGSLTDGVPLEPNHSHFVLVQGLEWGNETATMFSLAQALSVNISNNSTGTNKTAKKPVGKKDTMPSLVILTGGGEVTKKEIVRAVRQNLGIIVIEESGVLPMK